MDVLCALMLVEVATCGSPFSAAISRRRMDSFGGPLSFAVRKRSSCSLACGWPCAAAMVKKRVPVAMSLSTCGDVTLRGAFAVCVVHLMCYAMLLLCDTLNVLCDAVTV
jgi:hypothetical protein